MGTEPPCHPPAGVQAGLHGAFMAEGFGVSPPWARSAGAGALQGRSLAVKDVFDVQGQINGCGSPLWSSQQAPARTTAVSVRLLLDAGAHWVGRTVTDELTYSLAGINAHHGTPLNAAAPDRIPGGSSSGSAAAVAGGHADIGLGTDCGGSVRVPASYCGLWGLRPTHGRIATQGCFTLAHSFDTVGVLTRDGALLTTVFEQLVQTQVAPVSSLPNLVVADDLLPLLDAPVQSAFQALVRGLAPAVLPVGTLALAAWAEAFRVLQAAEIWQQHGHWFMAHGDSLGADIASRFQRASAVDAAQVARAQACRAQACEVLARCLPAGTCLLMPTVPTAAPRRSDPPQAIDAVRSRSQQLLCLAGLARLPQLTLPWCRVAGAPVGLSLVGAAGTEEQLLAGGACLHEALAARAVAGAPEYKEQ